MNTKLSIWGYFQNSITETDLRYIADSDCGFDKDLHYKNLKGILSTGILPEKLEWEPREVLSLVRWEDYNDEDFESVNRVFFSSFILLAATEQENSMDLLEGQVENVIISIDCANALGREQLEILYQFFEYLIPKLSAKSIEEDLIYFNLGFYLLSKILCKPNDVVKCIVDNTISAEKQVREYLKFDFEQDILKYTCFDQKINLWQEYLSKYDDELYRERLTSPRTRTRRGGPL